MVTVSELLDFIASHAVDPDGSLVVRRIPGGNGQLGLGGVDVEAISLTDDGRVQIDVR